ncbi:MAG: potassium channel protein [Chloroflexi bacterium]|nr:potassium channel protein [Chloroflexota bacterium]
MSPNDWRRRLGQLALLVASLVLIGTVGYRVLENYTWLEALYMTLITLSTVGYGEVRPLSEQGRVFTMGLIVLGVGTGAYLFSALTEYIISGELQGTLERRRRMKAVNRLNQHYIVCGCGRVGEQVAAELARMRLPFVVVTRDPEAIARCKQHGFLYIEGDPAEDAVLLQAGIQRARGLVAVLDSDADNLFVVLSARSLNPNLSIVAQAVAEDTEKKLYKAGADRVVSPYTMAGHRMVSLLVRPYISAFLDATLRSPDLELWLEEIRVSEDSELVGKTLAEADIRARSGANVLAIARGGKQVDWSPTVRIQPGDVLIVLGRRDQLLRLAEMAGDTRLVRLLRQSEGEPFWARRFPLDARRLLRRKGHTRN